MTELRKNPDQAFWDIIDANRLEAVPHDELGVEEASYDADITAVYELRVLHYTTAVSPRRAEIIETMIDEQDEAGYTQLISEVQRKFSLTNDEMKTALERCERRAVDKKNKDIEWLE